MNIVDIIIKKKNKEVLTKEEINYVITNYVNGNIKDYQMSSLLMAIVLQGMNFDETYYLTDAMLKSGEKIDLSMIGDIIVDKHSTGGVGDKTTLILAPLVASCGVHVAKMSGRGLGHTGGTIDKLESIPNFKTSLTKEEFVRNVQKIDVAIASGTSNLVPADKKIYALRDVTGTVESIPLIASSIMSKKLASGANKIVIDLKVGNGALMKTLEDAKVLAKTMIEIGKKSKVEVICVLSNMNEPLGTMIGNALEVKETIDLLNGKGSKDLEELTLTLATIMVSLGKNISYKEAHKQVLENLQNKNAYNKFLELVNAQNGNINELKISDKYIDVKAQPEGYVRKINTLELGNLTRNLKAGRLNKDDVIDYTVGLQVLKKVGDYVKKDEIIARIYYNEVKIDEKDVQNCFEIGEYLEKEPLIYEIIGDINVN